MSAVAMMVVREAVDLAAREILRRVYQESGHARGLAMPDRDVTRPPEPFDFEVVKDLPAQQTPVRRVVERVDERRVHALLRQSLRERARNVAQAARFGERHSLRRKESYAHCPL